ncbi:class I SAM-dependent methyltransferase [Bifidobacterium sp.]|uniref:class I SAM-dependent methyltransferase n=1 Tax=Bifidobacterium sp. TaxID=41200 RepID=UPI0039EB0517
MVDVHSSLGGCPDQRGCRDRGRIQDRQDINDNLENWNDRATVHMNGGYGDIDAFADNPEAITQVVRRDYEVLAPHLKERTIQGKRLLHLQCHIGLDTVSWYRLGAMQVHGLDFSDVSLDYAKSIAERAHATIDFVQGDARHADLALPDCLNMFDAVVTSVGTITWLPELSDWARSIASLLAPGGVFMVRDDHPLLFALDNSGLDLKQGYFSGTESTYESDASYTKGSAGKIAHTKNHNWAHDFHEIVGSLIDAGLAIESLDEHRIADWQSLPMLVPNGEEGGWRMPQELPDIPLTFSIVARKGR